MRRYLDGKGRFQVHRISGPRLAMLGDASADAVVAHGVFVHLDLDETYWFLTEFARVLRPGGVCSFTFTSPASPDGIAIMREFGGPGQRSVFRPHHPEDIRCVAAAAGFRSRRHHGDPYPHRLRGSHPMTCGVQNQRGTASSRSPT